jgi:2-polyprenyl-3-methyl-5-hydroxy-6-metoxy-1,4-benzoquinol methylase
VEAPDTNAEAFWNRAAGTKRFTHSLHARFTRTVARNAHILDYGCGQGRLSAELVELGYTRVVGVDLPDGAVLRHHPRAWFDELLADFDIAESYELDARTMNGNPARILQLWATSKED